MKPALVLAASVLFTISALAQDSTLPLPEQLRSLPMRLTNGAILTANYAVASENQLLYFPPIFLNAADLDGQPFVKPDGFLREPVVNSTLVLRFYEPLKDIEWRADYLNTLRNHPEVTNELRALQKMIPASMLQTRRVALECRAGGITNTILEADLPDRDNELETRVSFRIPSDCVPAFRNLRAQDLDVVVRQLYRARFQTNDVLITFNSLRAQFGKLQLGLVPAPDNSLAGIILDATLPIGLVQSGNLNRSERLSEFLSTSVRLELLVRAGSTVDESLLGALFDHVLSEADWVRRSVNDNSNTIVTLLLSDRLQITAGLGFLTQLAASRTTETEQRLQQAITDSLRDNGKVQVVKPIAGALAGLSVGFPELAALAGAAGAADQILNQWDNAQYRQQQFDNYFRSFTNVQAWLQGQIPFLPGIRFGDDREGENIHWTETEGVIGQFTIGSAELKRRQSFRSLASRAEALSLLDLLFLPETKIGHVIFSKNNILTWKRIASADRARFVEYTPDIGTDPYITTEAQVRFDKPFAVPPQVILTAHAGRENPVASTEFEFILKTNNVTETNFTFIAITHQLSDGNPVLQYLGASWIAIGKTRLRDAVNEQAALLQRLPGLFGVTTNEFRAAGLPQPQMQPLRMYADGSFSFNFDTVPGRQYRVDASTNLQDWWAYRSFVATDFKATFATNRPAGFDRLFLRVGSE